MTILSKPRSLKVWVWLCNQKSSQHCCRYNVSCGQYIGEMARYLLAAPPSSLDTAHSVRLMFGTVYRTDYWPLDTTALYR